MLRSYVFYSPFFSYLLDFTVFLYCNRISYPFFLSYLPAFPAMNRKRDLGKELLAQEKVKRYRKRAYKKKNETRDRHKYINKIKKDQNAALKCYVL
jgi:hypothetical protein